MRPPRRGTAPQAVLAEGVWRGVLLQALAKGIRVGAAQRCRGRVGGDASVGVEDLSHEDAVDVLH
jgi:hypothetical protein